MGKSKKRGPDKFNDYYAHVYGERWESLKSALLKKKEHIIFASPLHKTPASFTPLFTHPYLFAAPELKFEDSKGYYFLDQASAYASLSLNIQKSDHVLDLCAAPGGKSLIIGSLLGPQGKLTANDKSLNRRLRMLQNLKQFLGSDFVENQVRVTGFDASSWCLYEKEAYDKILLDAPCSSERHILESPKHLEEWREGRTKRLSKEQWTMLASAWLVLKTGGQMVYSTCSISPLENDDVVEKLIKKFKSQVEVIRPEILEVPEVEKTKHGSLLLPDHSNLGPFYLSVLKKS